MLPPEDPSDEIWQTSSFCVYEPDSVEFWVGTVLNKKFWLFTLQKNTKNAIFSLIYACRMLPPRGPSDEIWQTNSFCVHEPDSVEFWVGTVLNKKFWLLTLRKSRKMLFFR